MNSKFNCVCCLGILLLAAMGCGGKAGEPHPDKPNGPPTATNASGYKIVVVGHSTQYLMDKIANETKTKVEKTTGQAKVDLGNGASIVCVPLDEKDDSRQLLQGANLVLVAINAPDGPMPIHRSQLQLARDANVPKAAVVFMQTEMVDDGELLELVELEIRELLNMFKFSGDKAEVMFDDANAKTKNPKGISTIVEKLRGFAGK